MKNETIINEAEAMMEEDAELFEDDFEDEELTSEKKAFNVGKKVGEFMQKPVVKIGCKIVKGAALLGATYVAYKKGFSDGVESTIVYDDEAEDYELEELLNIEKENEESGSNVEEG